MNMPVGTERASQTRSAMERITLIVLDEIAVAYVLGDINLLTNLEVTPEQAANIHNANRHDIARMIAAKSTEFGIAINQKILKGVLNDRARAAKKEKQCRELINAGATQAMLEDIGFCLRRAGTSSRQGMTGMRRTHPDESHVGRPQAMGIRDIQKMYAYWSSLTNPGRIDPIEHLLMTAQYMDISVASIWSYIVNNPCEDVSAPIGSPNWVMVMFPQWPEGTKVIRKRR